MKELIEKMMEDLEKNIPSKWIWLYDVKYFLEKHLQDKIIIDKSVVEEMIESMSTLKAISETKGSMPYSNWYADWYKQALQSLLLK